MSTITETMTLIGFPKEAMVFFEELYLKFESDELLMSKLISLRELYFEKFNCDELCTGLSELYEKAGYHKHSVDMLFLLFSAIRLEKIYSEKGYSRQFFIHNIKDLCYKVLECKNVCGIWGIMNFSWQEGLFNLSRFALGRLQYNYYKNLYDYKDIVKKGDDVLYIHIPSSGPLLPEDVENSFRMAYDFFGPTHGDKLALMSHTWLFYPPMAEKVYPEGSNSRLFYERFDIINQSEDVNDSNIWRVFGKKTCDLSLLPTQTGMQKRLYEYLKSGKHTGFGYGMIVYKPEK